LYTPGIYFPPIGEVNSGGNRNPCGTKRKGVQAYLANVNFADECVGMLLDALDASPYKDNTIITI